MALIDFGAIIKGATKGLLTTVEKSVAKLYDENIGPIGKQYLKDGAVRLIDENYDKVLKGMHGKIRGWIDKIDGVAGNLPPLPGEAVEVPAEPVPEVPAEPMTAERQAELMQKRGLTPPQG